MSERVLIVEDEALLAMSLEDTLLDAGMEVLGVATCLAEARELGERLRPSLAFVDVTLTDGPTGVDAARHLADLGATVVFMTGNVRRIPGDFAGAVGAIEKPYTEQGLANALEYLCRLSAGGEPGNRPPGLLVAPGIPHGD